MDAFAGIAAPLLIDDIDTDQIAPASDASRRLDPDYAALFFARRRFRADGSADPAFVLNVPQFRAARILVTGAMFGCGSARETAVWSLAAFGIRCIVARSFAEMYRHTALRNGIIAVVLAPAEGREFEDDVVRVNGAADYRVDVAASAIVAPSGRRFVFALTAAERALLPDGEDEVAATLRHVVAIADWERRTHRMMPWLQETPRCK